MNKLSAVFWDVDGTIADTELCGHRVAFNMAFKDFDLDWFWNESRYLDLLKISGGLNRIIHYRDEIRGDISDDKCSKIQSRKRFHYKELIRTGKIKVRYGVLRLISELYECDIEQFIVTTSGRESLDPFLDSSLHSHSKYFSKIITYEDVSRHKPFPDAYNFALEFTKASISNCIAIEDSNIGVEAAKAAKLNCLLTLAPWITSYKKITKKANAAVDSLGDSNKHSKLIYGKELSNNFVNLNYLNKIIN